jgi:hypothetical protein
MDYAEAVSRLEEEIDRAVSNAESNGLEMDEIISELGKIAQGWKDSR